MAHGVTVFVPFTRKLQSEKYEKSIDCHTSQIVRQIVTRGFFANAWGSVIIFSYPAPAIVVNMMSQPIRNVYSVCLFLASAWTLCNIPRNTGLFVHLVVL